MTDDITVSRELLQRMVNAIDMLIPTLPGLNDKGRTWLRDEIIESTDALRAALEQPAPVQEPAAEILSDVIHRNAKKLVFTHHGLSLPVGTKLYTATQPAPVQEPIGWSITCNGGHTGNFFPYRETAEATLIELNRKYPTDKRTIEPLFAAQPRKAVKLTDEEISTIAISNPPNVHIYARAIEQAVLKANGIEP